MSRNIERTARLLLRSYPPAWRARYGGELTVLIARTSDGDRVPWRTRLDVVRAGAGERLRRSGLDGDGPGERARGGVLVALCGWALFVVGGGIVAKTSEHWRSGVPAGARRAPADAFLGLQIAAALGSALVVLGAATALPRLIAFVRSGGWPAIRRPIEAAAALTALAAAGTAGLAGWAHTLEPQQRAGSDAAYAAAFVAWAALLVACLFAWTVAGVATGRRLQLSATALRSEAWVAAAVTATMAAMAAATGLWWSALPGAAPVQSRLVAAAVLMAVGTLLGLAGSVRALRPSAALG